MLKPPHFRPQNALCYVLMPHFKLVVKFWSVLENAACGERVHLWAKFNEHDDRIAHGIILEIADFAPVNIGFLTVKLRKLSVFDLTKVTRVSKLKARIYLLRQVVNIEV